MVLADLKEFTHAMGSWAMGMVGLGYSHQNQARSVTNRKKAGQLIQSVLEERITPSMALSQWPYFYNGNYLHDETLNAAYQALWHFESDEDHQQDELYYMDIQLELLKQVASYLCRGKDLPGHILAAYPNKGNIIFYGEKPFAPLPQEYLRQCLGQWRKTIQGFQNGLNLQISVLKESGLWGVPNKNPRQ
ncbi:MAG: hypothetical protein KTR14_11300 [Vampirovibrio sp.]|nr:hypothetical protein [Vampirovibrio sp.]